MALTPGFDHTILSEVLSTDQIQGLVTQGAITQDDADFAFDLQTFIGPPPFQQAAAAISDFAFQQEEKIVGDIGGIVGGAANLLTGLDDKIQEIIQAALAPALDIIRAIPAQVMDGVNLVTESVGEIVDSLQDRILGPIFNVLASAINLIQELDGKVRETINFAVAPIIAVSDSILDQVQGFATALRDTIPELADTLGGAFSAAGDAIGDAVRGAFQDLLDSTGLSGIKDIMAVIARIPELANPQDAFSPDITEKMGPSTLEEYMKNPAAVLAHMIPFINTLTQMIFVGQIDRIQQASRGDANAGLLPISDMTTLNQRGLVGLDAVNETGFRMGLSKEQVADVFNITRQRPGTVDIIDYWRRELITDEVATNRLRDLGWGPTDVDLIKESSFPPPGVQDLIRMAVREVFSPEIAEQFGQFEGIPPKYIEWAKKIGLSEEWATNFWAAHWVLPSVQQGFEMLHRNVIQPEDLERLLVALDVMPFWREPLTEIAFRPFTRVDVRRMFALGVLDEAGVNRAFLDLGFNQEKADAMTLFTVRWVESTRKVEKEKERDLTKGDIIGLFNDGLLTESEARTQLERMGFDANESDLLISREIMQELRQDRKADIRLVVDQAKIKVLTFSEAQDRLNALDLTQRELQRAMLEVQRATSEKTRLPSKADLDSWQQLNLLSLVQYETELDNLGFPAKYVALYVEEIQLEAAEDLLAAEEREARKDEPRPITKGQLDSLLRAEIIGIEEYQNGLEALGFDEQSIANFTVQITVQIEELRIEDEERAARGEEAAEAEKLLSRVVLGKLLIKGIINVDAYMLGLEKLGFSVESIELLTRLILEKIQAIAEEGD